MAPEVEVGALIKIKIHESSLAPNGVLGLGPDSLTQKLQKQRSKFQKPAHGRSRSRLPPAGRHPQQKTEKLAFLSFLLYKQQLAPIM